MLREWHTLVVMRSITGVSKSSLRRYASLVRSYASWLSEGSSMGTLAAFA